MDESIPSERDIFGEDSDQEDRSPARDVSERDVSERDVSERDVSERDVSERDVSERDVSERDVSERDVFGSDDEELPDSEAGVKSERAGEGPSEVAPRRPSLDEEGDVFGEDAEEADVFPTAKVKTHARLSLPSLPPCLDEKIVVRMPTFMNVQDKCFDESTHDDKAEEDLFRGAAAIIRWRYVLDEQGAVKLDASGQPMRESNARLVKFTDGSMQLVVGDAVFDTELLPASNTYTYVQVRAATEPVDPGKGQASAPACFDCTGSVTSRMALKPSSLTSAVHRRMVSFMTSQTVRLNATKVRMDRHYNPEKTKQSRLKEEEDRIKREKKLRAQTESRRYSRRGPSMSAAYLEETDEANYDSVDIGRMKRGSYSREYYSDDEEMADFIVNDEEEGDDDEGDRWLQSKRGGNVSHRERELEVGVHPLEEV